MQRTNPKSADAAAALAGSGTPEALPGRLTKDRFGYSTPVDAPLYPGLPYHYRDAHSLIVIYETDEDAALDLLPEGLELSLPPTVHLVVFSYPSTTIGPYNEAALSLQCRWQGQPLSYIVHLVVTTDAAMAAGREIAGFPKKLAHIELREEDGSLHGIVERPRGRRLVTASMRLEQKLPSTPSVTAGTVTLRVIPSPEAGRPPSLAELVQMSSPMNIHETWSGPGTLSFDVPSDDDPWHKLPVRRIQAAVHTRADLTLNHGSVLKTY